VLGIFQVPLQIPIPEPFVAYINGIFLGFSIVVGYFVLFLFFYAKSETKRKTWVSLDWGERFFLGTLLGIVLLYSMQIGLTVVYYLYGELFWGPGPDSVFIWFESGVMVIFFVLLGRLIIGQPIHSEVGEKAMQQVREWIFSPFILLPTVFVFVLGCLSSYWYPLGGGALQAFWTELSGLFLVFLVGCVWVPGLICSYLAKVSSTRWKPSRVSFSFHSSWRTFLSTSIRALHRNRILLKSIVLLVLVAVFTTTADARLGLFSPRVDHIVTEYALAGAEYPYQYSVTGSVSSYRVLVYVSKEYFIDSPAVWLIRNMTILNPSNYSYSQPGLCYFANYGYYAGPPVFCGVINTSVSDSRIQLVTVANQSGSIQSFQVVLRPSSQSYTTVFSMNYYDHVSGKPIVAVYGTPVQTGVSSYRLINITLSNPFPGGLSIGQLQVGHYDDILKVSCAEEGVVYGAGCTSNSTTALWLWPQYLSPGKTMNFVLNVTYTGATYP
jgi:hypothetical protein